MLVAVLLAACGASPRWVLADPGQPSTLQQKQLAEAERRYRSGEPFDDQRREIARDPVTAWWWTRMVVRDVVTAREGRITSTESKNARVRELPQFLAEGRRTEPGDSDPLLLAAAGHKDPIEVRATGEIEALGVAAVPCLIHDLARHTQSYVRQIGIDLLGRVGQAALPAIDQELAASDDPTHRRTAAQAMAAMPPAAATEQRLRAFAQDAHYGVRAAAYIGLAETGAEAAPLVRRALADDADAFARRAAAKALASFREGASAQALVAYLQRCQSEHDAPGAAAAQDALQELARTRGIRSLDAWRVWAGSFAPSGG